MTERILVGCELQIPQACWRQVKEFAGSRRLKFTRQCPRALCGISLNHDFTGVLQFRGDPSQSIVPRSDSETAFNVDTFTRFQPSKVKLLLPNRRGLRRFAKPRTVEMEAVFLAVPEILPCSVDGIRQHMRWIVPIGFAASSDSLSIMNRRFYHVLS